MINWFQIYQGNPKNVMLQIIQQRHMVGVIHPLIKLKWYGNAYIVVVEQTLMVIVCLQQDSARREENQSRGLVCRTSGEDFYDNFTLHIYFLCLCRFTVLASVGYIYNILFCFPGWKYTFDCINGSRGVYKSKNERVAVSGPSKQLRLPKSNTCSLISCNKSSDFESLLLYVLGMIILLQSSLKSV